MAEIYRQLSLRNITLLITYKIPVYYLLTAQHPLLPFYLKIIY
jgi:hypothetical protein